MKNKWVKKGLVLFSAGCLAFAMTGCSQIQEQAQEIVNQVTNSGDSTEEEETQEEETVTEPEVEVAKPELTTDLSGSVTYKTGDTAKALTVEAATSDEGTITYQWYQSSTNKNGGGTLIEGATENSYVPSTEEAGTTYYYVVATSTIGNSSNGVTSATAEVIVTADDSQEGQEQTETSEGETQEVRKTAIRRIRADFIDSFQRLASKVKQTAASCIFYRCLVQSLLV